MVLHMLLLWIVFVQNYFAIGVDANGWWPTAALSKEHAADANYISGFRRQLKSHKNRKLRDWNQSFTQRHGLLVCWNRIERLVRSCSRNLLRRFLDRFCSLDRFVQETQGSVLSTG